MTSRKFLLHFTSEKNHQNSDGSVDCPKLPIWGHMCTKKILTDHEYVSMLRKSMYNVSAKHLRLY